MNEPDFLSPRRCLREPIPELFAAAHNLDQAVGAHLAGDRVAAEQLIRRADALVFRQYWDSIAAAEIPATHRRREIENAPPTLPVHLRATSRNPTAATKREVIERYGYNCAFCGLPVIGTEVRKAIQKAYPEALRWGRRNDDCHTLFLCLWLQFDHLLPHSRGGDGSSANIVVTCGPCNYGRAGRTVEELGLIDPRYRPVRKTSWDGLERFLA